MLSSVSEREKQMLYIVVYIIRMGLLKGEVEESRVGGSGYFSWKLGKKTPGV